MQIDRRTMSLLGLAAMLSPTRAWAEDAFPTRPIHVIVGFTPGAAADITARVLASRMSQVLNQQVVVENKPGAGSSLAADYVSHAAKDGYTLLIGTSGAIAARFFSVVASATSLPSRTCAITVEAGVNTSWMRPPSRSVIAWALPA